MNYIKIKNASENNLKDISLDIPLHKITSIIGVSGSGKSSLIYNVIANEAKRRERIDSGNANRMDYALRAKFNEINNLPYCITLKQRGLSTAISSTIATITKIHELLREEFTKYGEIVTENGNIIKKPTIKTIKEFIQKFHSDKSFKYYAVLSYQKYTNGVQEIKTLKDHNIKEAIFISSLDNKEKVKKISTVKELNSSYHHTILASFNKLQDMDKYESVAVKSFLFVSQNIKFFFNIDFPDIQSGKIYQKKSAQLLSFNSTDALSGACSMCDGQGKIESIDWNHLIIKNKKLNQQFLNLEYNSKGCCKYVLICQDTIARILKENSIKPYLTFNDLDLTYQKILKDFISPKMFKHQGRASIGKFIQTVICKECKGTRLNYKANAVKLYEHSISELLQFSIDELYNFLQNKNIHHKKILETLLALKKATLGYLTLDRTTDTLSGGELQRLKFAIELQSEYKNMLYILDEPSNGLHPFNNHQMIQLIKNLRDKSNTIIISEHNNDYISSSDYIIELGPGSGEKGGKVLFSGKYKPKSCKKVTYQRTKKTVDHTKAIHLYGVRANNIDNEHFTIPLNALISVSGVSGSGKSTLIHNVLVPTIKQYVADGSFNKQLIDKVDGLHYISSVIELTQSQIGINSRSIVATYLNLFDKVRDIYAKFSISKEFGFDKGYFSFNSILGQCDTCKGLGQVEEIICSSCLGNRYKPEVLDVIYNDKNIIEFLNTPIASLDNYFNDDKLKFAFDILDQLGLSHITLGRTTPTLSGGEAQRLKLAKVLIESFQKIKKGDFLFILDEPTTGLSDTDIIKIYEIFDKILFYKNSIIIIEHNLEIIKNSDFIIDMGISSGKDGGKNIFSGSYAELLKHKTSITAKALRGEYQDFVNISINIDNLKEKIYKKAIPPSDCHLFYLDDKHFTIEKTFTRNYQVVTDNEYHKYFKTKEDIFIFAKSLGNIEVSFNPYVTDLFRYKKVPISYKKAKLKHFKKLGFNIKTDDWQKDEWEYRVQCNDIKRAYSFGNGWVTVSMQGKQYELFTRLVSVQNKIIGTPKIDVNTFSLYLNSCIYCDGSATKQIYDINLIIADKTKSILESGFFCSDIKINLKTVVTKFLKERLFDFTKPFNQLTKEEENILLFGFKEHKFLKPKGDPKTLHDYIEWKGIYFYIYDKLRSIKHANLIKESQHSQTCPFCNKGFRKEVDFYIYDNKFISNYL